MHSPPTAQLTPRRRLPLAPAQRHPLPEHFLTPSPRRRTPTQPRRPQAARCMPADSTTHSPPKTFARPRTATRPSRALPLPHAAPTHTRRLRHAFLADLTTHFPPKTSPRPCTAHALPEHFRSPAPRRCTPTQRRRTPAGCAMHSSPKTCSRPRSAALPLLPFRFGHKKNGTAQWMCDAECLGRPSLRSVIGVGEPRAVRRRFGALAWRVGLRPQPWALRSRRCGRVLRA